MTGDEFDLRAHESVFDRVDSLAVAAIPDDLWDATMVLLRLVMDDPDSCRRQGIRWPGSDVSAYRMSKLAGRYEVQVWWSMVDGRSFVGGLTFDPPLDA